MGQAFPNQHPAVVLRSRYRQLRALLAIAMVAVIGLTVAVVVLAMEDNGASSTTPATQVSAPHQSVSGPDESRIADAIGTAQAPTTTGGPDESSVAQAVAGH
jgi:hypothetical protein